MIAGTRVLVTGAGGFVGSHLAEELLKRGATVRCMLRYNSASSRGNLAFIDPRLERSMEVIPGNIEGSDFGFRAMEGVDVVLHLAALIAIPHSYVAPRSYVRTNVEGTLNVLEAARRLGTARVVHTSTSEVYGTALRVPIDEEHPLRGQSPYSASKIGADKIAESYYRSFGTPVVTLRPFNTFGLRQSARAFFPTIIAQALERNEKPIRYDPSRARPTRSEVGKLISDNRKALRLMAWHPRTNLDDGLTRTIEFIDRHHTIYQPMRYAI